MESEEEKLHLTLEIESYRAIQAKMNKDKEKENGDAEKEREKRKEIEVRLMAQIDDLKHISEQRYDMSISMFMFRVMAFPLSCCCHILYLVVHKEALIFFYHTL
tara:strand:+ start:27 stop:338 length:312 start_codon:yes stop_codon:yes gene_type:complete